MSHKPFHFSVRVPLLTCPSTHQSPFVLRAQDADENLAIDNNLLCEIEAESWVNGTRGILVESRAPPLPRLEQDCSLLCEATAKSTAAKAKAAAAMEKCGADALYRMPWQKLQVKDDGEADRRSSRISKGFRVELHLPLALIFSPTFTHVPMRGVLIEIVSLRVQYA